MVSAQYNMSPVVKLSRHRERKCLKILFAICLVFLIYGTYWIISSSRCSSFASRFNPKCNPISLNQSSSQTMHIEVYYEVLCPDSINFITKQLFPFAMKLREENEAIQKIFKIDLYAFGKAQEIGTGENSTFTCKHGIDECIGNMWHSCAWNHNFSESKADPIYFVGCTMSKNDIFGSFSECAMHANIPMDELKKCVNGPSGHQYMHMNAVKTLTLPHKLYYVPWIRVNEDDSMSTRHNIEHDLLTFVCAIKTFADMKMCQKPNV